jgi:hypothetical protein
MHIDAEANLGRLCSLLNVAALLAADPCLTTDEQRESTAPGLMDSFEEAAKRLIGIMKDEGIEPAENTVEARTLARAIAEGKDMTSVVDAAMDNYVDLLKDLEKTLPNVFEMATTERALATRGVEKML